MRATSADCAALRFFATSSSGFGVDRLLEEPGREGQAIIQRDQALADERDDLQQTRIIHWQALPHEIRLDAGSQVLGLEQADMGGVEVVQLGKIDRRRGGRQVVDVEAGDHLVQGHHVIFGNAPAHQDDPVQHAFRDVAQTLSCRRQKWSGRP